MLSDMGQRIKEQREYLRLSQEKLGTKIGVTRTTVGAYERGAALPSVDVLLKMCELFHQPSDYLMGLDSKRCISVDGLNSKQLEIVKELKHAFLRKNAATTSALEVSGGELHG